MNAEDSLHIIVPALGACLLVLLTHVPLGFQVLRRGIVFIDLAIAQIAGLGLIAATLWGWEPQGLAMQLIACGSALAGAALLAWMERRWPDVQEAQIGAVFVLAACAGVLLLAGSPQGDEHLRDLLAGQLLWIGPGQLLWPAVGSGMLAAVLLALRNEPPPWLFYALFAISVTLSVQLLGVYLVFACLILPALATRRLRGGPRLAAGYTLGAAASAAGLLLSLYRDLPSSALIVCVMAVLGVGVYAMSGRRG